MILFKSNKSLFFWALIFLVMTSFLQHTPQLIDQLFSHISKVESKNNQYFTISLEGLPKGDYLISLGRPRAHCDIFLDSEVIFKGKSTVFDKRFNLLAAGAFHRFGKENSVVIDCIHPQTGFGPRLSFEPKIYDYNKGMLVHFYRAAVDLFIGPLAAMLLVIASLVNLFLIKNNDSNQAKKYLAYSLVSFFYALSLSYYTRIFLPGMLSSQIHIFMRFAFSLFFNLLLGTNLVFKRFVILSHILIMAAAFSFQNPESLDEFYKVVYILMPLCTTYAFFDLLKNPAKSNDLYMLQIITLSWTFAQYMDNLKLVFNFGFYNAPFYILIISLILIYRIYSSFKLDELVVRVSGTINAGVSNARNIQEGIQSVLMDISKIVHFEKLSCYVDEYVLGAAEKSGEYMRRIYEIGYDGEDRDSRIDILNSFSATTNALKSNKPFIGKGAKDGQWYVIVPILNLVTINLSTKRNIEGYKAFESFELIQRLEPILKNIKTLLEQHGYKYNSSLAKLRPILGDGLHEMDIGAIFIDVVDYSKHTESYGDDYPNFISSKLFPALVKFMSPYAIPEVVRGDEIYFVVTSQIQPEAQNVGVATAIAICKLDAFIKEVAPGICLAAGFPKLEVKIGATHGRGAIVVDDVQVRTSGDHINKAKRLQDSAQKGEILVDAQSFHSGFDGPLVGINQKTIVAKKNVIEVVRVGVKRAA